MDSFITPHLIALGPIVFAVVAYIRKLTARPDGSLRIDGLAWVSLLTAVVSLGVIVWAYPSAPAVELLRKVPLLFVVTIGGTQGLQRLLTKGTLGDGPSSPPQVSLLPPVGIDADFARSSFPSPSTTPASPPSMPIVSVSPGGSL